MTGENIRRTWAEIDLDAIAHNLREIQKFTSGNARIMAVVKADAYGHGALAGRQKRIGKRRFLAGGIGAGGSAGTPELAESKHRF